VKFESQYWYKPHKNFTKPATPKNKAADNGLFVSARGDIQSSGLMIKQINNREEGKGSRELFSSLEVTLKV
jgi:hypothetical protein